MNKFRAGSLIAVAVAVTACASTPKGVERLKGRQVSKMHVGVTPTRPLCPGEPAQVVVVMALDNGEILTSTGAGQGDFRWADISVGARSAEVNETPSGEMTVMMSRDASRWDGPPTLTVSLPSRPDVMADPYEIPYRLDCEQRLDLGGEDLWKARGPIANLEITNHPMPDGHTFLQVCQTDRYSPTGCHVIDPDGGSYTLVTPSDAPSLRKIPVVTVVIDEAAQELAKKAVTVKNGFGKADLTPGAPPNGPNDKKPRVEVKAGPVKVLETRLASKVQNPQLATAADLMGTWTGCYPEGWNIYSRLTIVYDEKGAHTRYEQFEGDPTCMRGEKAVLRIDGGSTEWKLGDSLTPLGHTPATSVAEATKIQFLRETSMQNWNKFGGKGCGPFFKGVMDDLSKHTCWGDGFQPAGTRIYDIISIQDGVLQLGIAPYDKLPKEDKRTIQLSPRRYYKVEANPAPAPAAASAPAAKP